jgi:hypothetical protein
MTQHEEQRRASPHCVVSLGTHRERGLRCELLLVNEQREIDYDSLLDRLIADLPLDEGAATILRSQSECLPHGRGIDIRLDTENFHDASAVPARLHELAMSPGAASSSSSWVESTVADATPLWILERCHKYRLHSWERPTEVRPAHCRKCFMDRMRFQEDTAFGVHVPWIDHQITRGDELPCAFGPTGHGKRLRLLLDVESFSEAVGQEQPAIHYLGMLEGSNDILTARMKQSPPFPAGALLAPQWNVERPDHARVSLGATHSDLERADVGFASTIDLWSSIVGGRQRAEVAVAGNAFHAIVTTDRRLLQPVPRPDSLHTTLLPSEAVRLVGLKLRMGESIRLRTEGPTSGLLREDLILAQAHSRVPNLRRAVAALLEDETDDRAPAEPIRALASLESRLVHLLHAEDRIGHATYSDAPGVEVEMAYHLDHFVLLAQALIENLKWLIETLYGLEESRDKRTFMKRLAATDRELSSFLSSAPGRNVWTIVGTLRIPSAHQEHWLNDLSSFGHIAAASRYRLTMRLVGEASEELVRDITSLSNNPDDWGIAESAGLEPREFALDLDPYPFAVHLNAHLAWFLDATLSQIKIDGSPSRTEIDGRVKALGESHPALDEQWHPYVSLLDWPIPQYPISNA